MNTETKKVIKSLVETAQLWDDMESDITRMEKNAVLRAIHNVLDDLGMERGEERRELLVGECGLNVK